MNTMTTRTFLFITLAGIAAFTFSCREKEQEKSVQQKIAEWNPAYLRFKDNIPEEARLPFCFQNGTSPVPASERVFPKHYGGTAAYLPDRTKTIIYLTDTSEQAKQEIVDLCQLTRENYVFKKCEYSRNEMLQIINQINDTPDLYEEWGIIDMSVDIENGRIEINFFGESDENKIMRFRKEVLDLPLLAFHFPADEEERTSPPSD